nr:hypothetical protein [Tanacetum cinerariifolium]
MQTQEDHSNPIPALNADSLKVDLVVIQNTYSRKEDSNSETASNKSVKESSLDSSTKDVHAIKYKMSKSKERCMTYFRSLHSHLQVLSKEHLKGTRIEHGFKRAFVSLFGQDADTFTKSEVQDDINRSGNDADADDANIRPIYDEEPMAEFKPRNTMSTKVPTTNMISMTSMIELESLFGPSFDEYFNGENQVVLKSSAATTTDASNKRQQQPDSSSSTSTLASTVTADGNIDL